MLAEDRAEIPDVEENAYGSAVRGFSSKFSGTIELLDNRSDLRDNILRTNTVVGLSGVSCEARLCKK